MPQDVTTRRAGQLDLQRGSKNDQVRKVTTITAGIRRESTPTQQYGRTPAAEAERKEQTATTDVVGFTSKLILLPIFVNYCNAVHGGS